MHDGHEPSPTALVQEPHGNRMPDDTRAENRPGSGRRRAPTHPKGRMVDSSALAAVRETLGDLPRRRDLLIEHLHRIQDRFGGLSPAHLVALADEMRLSIVEVYEVATFYAHFDVLADGQPYPPTITVRVCESISCHLRGGVDLCRDLKASLGPEVRVVPGPCMGQCDEAPAAMVGQNAVGAATVETVSRLISEARTEAVLPPYPTLSAYRAAGGYTILERCRSGGETAEEVIAAVEAAGLRGLGGAGFRAAQKWRMVGQADKPRLIAINADEGEPGTFKDRVILESQPHRMLEGALIAAWAVGADAITIYLRDEYPHIREILTREIDELVMAGLGTPVSIHLRRGAGAYICGEETAMLESIEGKRGYPRHKPPYPTQAGLFGRPTLIHNVETVSWLPDILANGPEWFAGLGRDGRGPRSFSVSGRVKNPGVKVAPAGITARELIEQYCGGMEDGQTFKAYLPGGASGGILPASLGDVPLDFGTLEPHGAFIGSAAIVVFSQQDNMRDVALNLMRFFEDESCGQCTPCRCGTEKAVALMTKPRWDEPLLAELSGAMRDASICGLGQAATNPILSVLRYFPEDLA